MAHVPLIGWLIPTAVLVADIAIVALIALLAASRNPSAKVFLRRLAPSAIPGAFTLALASMLGSLFYSNVEMLTPCTLCWYQRILMYPLVLVFGIALMKGDRGVIDYAAPFAVGGLLLALYHYASQMAEIAILCTAGAECSARYITSYGFITIPFMAMTAFAGILVLLLLSRLRRH
ncbi:disulfide bond formation protein B [Candidatus Woesearchaeota archaeon]|nr:disulfide bond formation protein B [Candidatus Woesearchaeota archaeon]